MKTPLFISQRARAGMCLVLFTAILTPDAQCGSPLKRVLGRIGNVLDKIGDDDDDDSRKTHTITRVRRLEYDPPLTIEHRTYSRTAPRQLSSHPYDANDHGSVIPVPAGISQSSTIINKPTPYNASPGVPVVIEKQHRVYNSIEYQNLSGPSARQLSPNSYNPGGNAPELAPIQKQQRIVTPTDYQTPSRAAPLQQSLHTYDPSRNAPETNVSSLTGQWYSTPSRPPQASINSVVPSDNEPPQRMDTRNPPALRDLPLDYTSASSSAPSSYLPTSTVQDPKPVARRQASPSETETPIKYARPVVGQPGFVYSPGVIAELPNRLDVRGCAPGEKMRDPRTGTVFLVP